MKKIPMLLMMVAPYIFIGTCVEKGLGSEVFVAFTVINVWNQRDNDEPC